MKKIIVLLVAATLVAAPAFAVIRNSKHDLSMSSGTATVKSDTTTETCVFCHTPHGGITGIMAPLWNRSLSGGGIVLGDLYNSATLDQINSRPSIVLTAVQNSDAPLCLSCHDGGSLAGGLQNPPNSTGQPTFTGGDVVTGQMDLGDSPTLLKNDHPIGMDYSAVYTADTPGFKPETDATKIGVLPLYTDNGVMWCSTCHDVHNQGPVGATPFLNMSNAGSALCTACHIK